MATQTGNDAIGSESGSVRELFSATVEHSKAYISAEKSALTLRIRLTARVLVVVVALGVVAAILALFAFGWLLVGLALLLAQVIGPIGAAFVIGVILAIIAVLCVVLARRALTRLPGTAT